MKDLIAHHQPQPVATVDENMSNLTSASNEASASSSVNRNDNGGRSADNSMYFEQHYFNSAIASQNQDQPPPAKKKRNLPGNPDRDAEVIALSPKTLLATNRFVCEICNKGFQRDQNLQLHKRGHNLPWKLKQRTSKEVRKKVYVCPEVSCMHHDPSRALGDLTGIKKHFCRKHGEKKWKCDKCSKLYAVQSDWKAHSKTCGTREYRCDCGTLFSRRDSFITHRAFCDALAEESARAITVNPLLTSSHHQPASSSSHVNVQQPQIHTHHDPLVFSMKKEQQNFSQLRSEIPPWLACPPGPGPPTAIDHHLTSTIFQENPHHHQDRMIQLHYHHPQQQQRSNDHQAFNPNPSPGGGPGYAAASPHISATALLQKAAQMGATMSNSSNSKTAMLSSGVSRPLQTHLSTDSPSASPGNLNLSSRDEFVNGLASYGNKAAATVSAGAGGPPSSSLLLQDMMNITAAATTTTTFHASTFEQHIDHPHYIHNHFDETNRFFSTSSNDHEVGRGGGGTSGAGGGGNDSSMTRDFLGLRPSLISHSDILKMAGVAANYMSPSSNTNEHHHHHHHHHQNASSTAAHQRSWQG